MFNSNSKLLVRMVLTAWVSTILKVENVFSSLSAEQFEAPIAPGAKSPAWILNHLTLLNDNFFPLFELGEPLYPKLIQIQNSKDEIGANKIPIEELKEMFISINSALVKKFIAMNTNEWFQKHISVTEEDFKNEPHRNKLNVLLRRTNQLSHYLGILSLLIINK